MRAQSCNLRALGRTPPRSQARLDAPGTLHHVILRGFDRGVIVKDDPDRAVCVARLGAVAQATGTPVYAWTLLPNHAHLLLQSGPAGLPQFMRRFLTGYAITCNRPTSAWAISSRTASTPSSAKRSRTFGSWPATSI